VQKARLGAMSLGLILALAACGRVPATSSAAETPAASAASSPTAVPTPLTIPGPTFHMGEVGLAYAPVSYQAVGGTAPYTWWVSAGALPGGLSMSTDGAISGTPIASGTFSFTVVVNDAGMAIADVGGSIAVVPQLSLTRISSASPGWPWDRVTRQDLADPGPIATQTGGLSPYTYSVVAGSLPPGTRLNGLDVIGLAPTGEYRFSVAVTDALGATATVSYFWDIIPPHPAR
jgi:large repetitive protein